MFFVKGALLLIVCVRIFYENLSTDMCSFLLQVRSAPINARGR
jgi:hypothetical protein